jgi:UDPglucose 6-dehydrogenase
VRIGMGSDSRIGKRFLFPGVGYGGSCFPKDVQALALTAKQHNYQFKLVETVMQVNDQQKTILGAKISAYFNNNLQGKTIAVWGLAFKPETDDIREAPALELIKELTSAGATVKAFDPEAMTNVKSTLGEAGIIYAKNAYEALENADALALVTEWSEFRNPNFEKIKSLLKSKTIFDGRNVFSLDKMKEEGFYYESIGRATITN